MGRRKYSASAPRRAIDFLGLVRNNTEFGMSLTFWRSLPRDLQRVLHAWLRAEAQANARCSMAWKARGPATNFAPRAASSSSFGDDTAQIAARVAPVIGDFVAMEEAAASGRGDDRAIKALTEKYRDKTPDQLMSEAIQISNLRTVGGA